MKAAVVTDFDHSPRYQDFATPTPVGPNEVLVDVVAAALSPRVRSQAAGSHYTSGDELPMIPGIDGVGRMPDGSLRYFLLPDTTLGSMAERAVIDIRRSIELQVGTDSVHVAAGMNPAMSSWVALRRRIEFQPGQSVLILGATGNAGRMAVQVAKRLDAGRVVAVGRSAERLGHLAGADAIVSLDGDPARVAQNLGEAGKDVDVVIDYLWGQPTADAMRAIIPRRVDDGQTLTWIQIGSSAGLESPIPSAALRAVRLQLVGSGQGSVDTHGFLAELDVLAQEITNGSLTVASRPVPLAEVETAWADTAGSERIVIVP